MIDPKEKIKTYMENSNSCSSSPNHEDHCEYLMPHCFLLPGALHGSISSPPLFTIRHF